MRKALFVFLITCVSTTWAQTSLSFARAVKKAAGCVVALSAERNVEYEEHPLFKDPFFKHFFDDQFKHPQERHPHGQQTNKAVGSGVIVSKDGYILTNYHVIQKSEKITVQLSDDRKFPAKLIGVDPDSDLAVLKIDEKNLPVAIIGNDQKLEVGDVVLAIGNPFGVGQTVTQGIVSAMQRKNLGLNVFESYIQTDAAINPGNSGGPLVDSEGSVVGINTAIISSSGGNNGIGFAVPISFAQQVMQELINDGHVTRGWLGVYMAELTDEIRKSINYDGEYGVLVTGIARSSPAAQAGIRPGDVIVGVNKKQVKSSSDISGIVLSLKPKSRIEVEVMRDNQEITFGVIIGVRSKSHS